MTGKKVMDTVAGNGAGPRGQWRMLTQARKLLLMVAEPRMATEAEATTGMALKGVGGRENTSRKTAALD